MSIEMDFPDEDINISFSYKAEENCLHTNIKVLDKKTTFVLPLAGHDVPVTPEYVAIELARRGVPRTLGSAATRALVNANPGIPWPLLPIPRSTERSGG